MPFDAMELFKAGSQLGEAQAGPASYATQNVMDMFTKQMEMQRQLQLQAGLFKSEKEYEYGTDPTKISAAYQNKLNIPTDGSQPQPGGGTTTQPNQPKWDETTEQQKVQQLVTNHPESKDAILNRFSQRKKEAMGGFVASTGAGTSPSANGTNGNVFTGSDIYGRKFSNLPGVAAETKAKEEATNIGKLDPMIRSAVNVMKTNMSAFKSMNKNTVFGGGRIGGMQNAFGGATGLNKEVNPYEGLANETAGEIAKISLFGTGARLGPDIINSYKKIVAPRGIYSTLDEIKSGTRNALQNAFARQAGYHNTPYNADDYEGVIKDVLDSPAFTD